MEKTRFDREAIAWDEKSTRVEVARQIAHSIEENVPLHDSMRLLDYGCGTGLVGLFLYDRVGTLLGVDSSQGMIEMMEKKVSSLQLQGVRCLASDVNDPQLSAGGYDLITAAMVFHHIACVDEVMQRFWELLDEGGYVAIADLVQEDGTFHQHGNEGVEHFGFDLSLFSHKLEQCGFTLRTLTTPYTVHRDDRSYPLFLIVGQKVTKGDQ